MRVFVQMCLSKCVCLSPQKKPHHFMFFFLSFLTLHPPFPNGTKIPARKHDLNKRQRPAEASCQNCKMLIMMMMLINSFKNIFHFSFTGRRVDLSEGTVGGSGNHVTREQRHSR